MYSIVLCTAPAGEAGGLAHTLVEEKLVACVNMTGVRSCFRWEGEVQEEAEDLLIMKTRTDRVGAVIDRVKELHPYAVPEVIALSVTDGYEGYLNWVRDSVE